MLKESTKTALEIVSRLMSNDTISEYKNEGLLNSYELNSEVAADIDEILEYFNCALYQGGTRELYITPSVDNKIFGFTNEDLKRELGVKAIPDIYVCYFIMTTVINMFFRDDSGDTVRQYVGTKDIVDEVSRRMTIFKDGIENGNTSREALEKLEGCSKLVNLWKDELPYTTSKVIDKEMFKQSQGISQIAYVNRTLKFMEKQGLTKYVDEVSAHYPTSRMQTLVYQVYKESSYLARLNEIFINFTEFKNDEKKEETTI